MDQAITYPVPFFIGLAVLVVGSAYSWKLRETGIGIPMLIVLATVGTWYFGDALYNKYNDYLIEIGPEYLEAAWWQVVLFMVSFVIFTRILHRVINKKYLSRKSYFSDLLKHGGLANEEFQRRIDTAAGLVVAVWIYLMIVALMRTNFDFLGLFTPYLTAKAYPWARGRIGGTFDSFVSFANYLNIMLLSVCGVVGAVSKNPRTRVAVLTIFILGAPWYLLDRTRNTMLAIVLPGLLAWVFLRFQAGILMKAAVLAVAFTMIQGWMKFVIATRSGSDVALVFQQVGLGGVVERVQGSEQKHAGLNMFEELGWVNNLIEKKIFQPNLGARYFAELVNPIPRGLWRDKPLIGIDYAIARGQKYDGARASEGGVGATLSTGMIGQGVVNYGPFFGVLAAAFIMAVWCSILARQDLQGDKTGRTLLFFMGCVLTFNLGRDITLITLYPFLFGWFMLVAWGRFKGET